MDNKVLFLQVIIVLVMVVVLIKVNNKKKESYCVDISGGFKAPCDGVGRCVVNG